MQKNGFTLIEVAAGAFIFSIIIVIVFSLTNTIILSQRKAFAFSEVVGGSRFILESISKEIRNGSNFSSGCGTNSLSFQRVNSIDPRIIHNVTYSLRDSRLLRQVRSAPAQVSDGENVISSDKISISRLSLCNLSGINLQPRITVILQARIRGAFEESVVLNLETTISQRELIR